MEDLTKILKVIWVLAKWVETTKKNLKSHFAELVQWTVLDVRKHKCKFMPAGNRLNTNSLLYEVIIGYTGTAHGPGKDIIAGVLLRDF